MIPGSSRFRFTAAGATLTFDGNSLIAGEGSSDFNHTSLPPQVAALPPVSGLVTATNLGGGGQTIRNMDGLDNGTSSDVDSSYIPGKKNVLVGWEATNNICNIGQSVSDTFSAHASYVANRRALHPDWLIVWLTTIPRQTGPLFSSSSQTDVNTFNGYLQAFDDMLRANYRAIGINVLVDVRQPGSPFRFANYLPASWDATASLWAEASGSRVHLTDAGYGVVANYVAAGLRRLPSR